MKTLYLKINWWGQGVWGAIICNHRHPSDWRPWHPEKKRGGGSINYFATNDAGVIELRSKEQTEDIKTYLFASLQEGQAAQIAKYITALKKINPADSNWFFNSELETILAAEIKLCIGSIQEVPKATTRFLLPQ
ncbi:MAG: hypothetical protein KA149_09210 [Chitinophagales bacterium]|nr:hypothetical protein [Chitinophagales bacterium]